MVNRRICYWCAIRNAQAKRKENAEKKELKKEKHKLTKSYYSFRYKKAWRLFSLYIRVKYSNEDGIVKCYTCPTKKEYKEMQAGHLYHNRLDFDERNIHPQCGQCNLIHSGRREIYSAELISEGVDLIKLRRDAESKVYTLLEVEGIIEKCTNYLKGKGII